MDDKDMVEIQINMLLQLLPINPQVSWKTCVNQCGMHQLRSTLIRLGGDGRHAIEKCCTYNSIYSDIGG